MSQTVALGVAYDIKTQHSRLRLLADARDLTDVYGSNFRKKLQLGAHIDLANRFGLAVGLRHGYPTAGVYADVYFLRVDFGSYTEELSDRVGRRPDQRLFSSLHGRTIGPNYECRISNQAKVHRVAVDLG